MNTMPSNNSDRTAPRLWRSVEEYADSEEFRSYLHREFPERAPEWLDPASRRTFLQLMGASLALAGTSVGLSGCDFDAPPREKVLPYVTQPENIVQGKSLQYATALTLNGFGTGVLVESNMGRPTMIEGNEKHPDSLGSIDFFTQSSLLHLYDPDRSQVVMHRSLIGGFDAFLLEAVAAMESLRSNKGAGLRLLTETITSPTLARLIDALLKEFPEAKWHQYDPAGPHSARAGARLAFGKDVSVRYDLTKADVIVSLDADFLACGTPGGLPMARGFGARREPAAQGGMNRLYVIEPSMSVTGSSSDHRLPLSAHEILGFTTALAEAVGVKVGNASERPKGSGASRFIEAIAADLKSAQGKGLIIAGESQPPYVHALTFAINHALGNLGTTVLTAEPIEAAPTDQITSIVELTRAMETGSVDVLFILGGNPFYNAPADVRFVQSISRAKFSARLGYYEDETSAACNWHIPESHELEAWGDVRATDGTVTIQQPLISPLYKTSRSASELIAALLRHPDDSSYEIVRATWKEKTPKDQDFETFWKTSVHDGVVPGTAVKSVKVEPKADLGPAPTVTTTGSGSYEVVFRPDPTIFDGRFANNGWLQELPKPISRLTWDNVAFISPETAKTLSVVASEGYEGKTANVVRLEFDGRSIEAPVWVLPGQADASITLTLGYGRTRSGQVGRGIGYDAYRLRTSESMGFGLGLAVEKLNKTQKIACTQTHRYLEPSRGLVRFADLAHYQKNPEFVHERPFREEPKPSETLYINDRPKSPPGDNHQWGLVVNLNACTGCSACVASCVAENNTPVIGKEQVLASREMHWMEIDRYFDGPPEDPEVYHQPRLCMHCEYAPCELVCPVEATVHDSEGLNLMVYNRCVGTRYCSNNCPYKVRHFNFLQYSPKLSDPRTSSLALLANPDVTVRARGVMEKCTYCIQRINEARYAAELEGRPMKDGDVVTACQAACPTQAITFGDTSDKASQVSKLKADSRNYAMLSELNTRPRTTYLAKLRNRNPALSPSSPSRSEGGSSHGD
jgi:molybdopterin-containing oxidoreductase family iron-sulfur binding subunit